MNKITPLFSPRQAVSLRKNKKGQIKRTYVNKSSYLQLFNVQKPEDIKHKEGFNLRSLLSTFTERNLKVTQTLVKQIIESGKVLSSKSRQYFCKASGFKSNQSISRLVVRLERMGLIVVDQFVKETNFYSLGPVLKDPVIANYLIKYIPSLRYIVPGLFSALLLSSVPSQKPHLEKNVSQIREVILFNSLKSYKNKDTEMKVKSFEHDFVTGSYSSAKNTSHYSWVTPKGVVHPHIFGEMSNIQRKKYFHANGWGHKDTDKGWVPVSQKLNDVLTCVEKWEEYMRSKR